jgi:putative tryptophan/tyrosine transport system substrate-binding protein
MKRRQFIKGLAGTAVVWPLAARAQQPGMPVVGFLGTRASGDDPQLLTAFRSGLKEAGYVEGQNVAMEYRFAENQYDRLPTLAAELVQRQVAVIVANGRAAQAAKETTATIPIAFVAGFDPVEVGLVASMNRPGGNVTGVSVLDVELGPKRLQLLHELVPTATIIAVLVNPNDPARAETTSKELQAAAQTLGLQLHVLHASTDRDFDTVFAHLVELRAGGLVIGGEPFFNSRSEQLGALTIRHAVPAIYQPPVRRGGRPRKLRRQPYGRVPSSRRLRRQDSQGRETRRPAGPVEMIINLKTAKMFGLTVPQSLLGRADEVIE